MRGGRRLAAASVAAFCLFIIRVSPAAAEAVIDNPLGSTTSACGLITNLLKIALVVGVPVLGLFLMYAGFLFVFARGNSAALEKARKNFYYVIIGSFVFFGSLMIIQIVANTINATAQGSGMSALSVSNCN
jgi:hypothetical protein